VITRAWPITPAERRVWQQMDEEARALAERTIAEAEPGEEILAICCDTSCFPDDVIAACSSCHLQIIRRPWHDAERVRFVCMGCAILNEGNAAVQARISAASAYLGALRRRRE
jgi:hypothetical protein